MDPLPHFLKRQTIRRLMLLRIILPQGHSPYARAECSTIIDESKARILRQLSKIVCNATYSCHLKRQLTLFRNRVQALADKETLDVGSESTALFLTNGSGMDAGCAGAPVLILDVSAKQTAKTTTKTV
jgi:hypothetical protein